LGRPDRRPVRLVMVGGASGQFCQLRAAHTRGVAQVQLAFVGGTQRLDRGRRHLDCHPRHLHRRRGQGVFSGVHIVKTLAGAQSIMRSQWFVIHTLSGQEQKVKESVEKRIKTEEMGEYIKEVMVPMEKVVEVRNQKKTVSTRKLWPGYVFIDVALLDDNGQIVEKPWYFINETPGVISIAGGKEGKAPTPTPV